MNNIALIEYRGKEYKLKYTFGLMQRMKAVGINFARVYRLATANGGEEMQDYADDIAMVVAQAVREAGADFTDEEFWEFCVEGGVENLTAVIKLFLWLGEQYYHVSPSAPKPKAPARKKNRTA